MARSEISQEVSGKSDLIHLFDCRALKEPTPFKENVSC